MKYLVTAQDAVTSLTRMPTLKGFCGHTHQPKIFEVTDENIAKSVTPKTGQAYHLTWAIVNPGSVGQPRDHRATASYAVYDSKHATVRFHRVAYDMERTMKDMKAISSPKFLIDRLFDGI